MENEKTRTKITEIITLRRKERIESFVSTCKTIKRLIIAKTERTIATNIVEEAGYPSFKNKYETGRFNNCMIPTII